MFAAGETANGREPGQFRYAINSPRLDSASTRLSWNPNENWSFQASWGYLASPEQLNPAVHETRVTASASYQVGFDGNDWATTLAWGRKENRPGNTLNGFLIASALMLDDRHTIFARIERANEDELFQAPNPLAGQIATANEFTLVTRNIYPGRLDSSYGNDPTSYMLFTRLKLS